MALVYSDPEINDHGVLTLWAEDEDEHTHLVWIGDALNPLTMDDPRLSNLIELAVDVVAAYREAVEYDRECRAEANHTYLRNAGGFR